MLRDYVGIAQSGSRRILQVRPYGMMKNHSVSTLTRAEQLY